MNSYSITDYILKLEKLNEESRTKIEQLKKLLTEANEDKVKALNELNDMKYKSFYHATARVSAKTINVVNENNSELVDHLLLLSETADDRFKSIAYRRGAEVIADLSYEVLSGESLLHLKGIGKSIASKIDEFLEEQDSDYEESIASDDDKSCNESDEDDYFISHNHDIYTRLMNVAGTESDPYKRRAYTNAASKISSRPFELTSGQEAMKIPGIGKSIAKKIDNFLTKDSNSKLADCFLKLGNLEPNQYKAEAYWLAEDKLRELDFEVTSSEDVKNIRGFGPSICAKIDEFVETGTMKRLDELN